MQNTQIKSGYQLDQSPFYKLPSRKKLAILLQISEDELKAVSNSSPLYVRRWKHKAKKNVWLKSEPSPEYANEYRVIDIPSVKLKSVQARIADLLSRLEKPDFLFSPVKGKSYVDNAAFHRGNRAFWMLDIANYYPNCLESTVAAFFLNDLKCPRDVTAIIARIVTLNGSLPQGSPCSPILSYFINMNMWQEIAATVKRSGNTISVYADDITISGEIVRKNLILEIKTILKKNGYLTKSEKEKCTINSATEITGVIVRNDQLFLPNRQLEKLVDLKRLYAQTTGIIAKAKIEKQLRGRVAQRRQIELQQFAT
jgi:hypothetical protein